MYVSKLNCARLLLNIAQDSLKALTHLRNVEDYARDCQRF